MPLKHNLCILSLASLSLLAQAAQPFNTSGLLTSKTPYPARQQTTDYSPPPAGFDIVMVQHIARHGSRGLTSADDDDLSYQLWQQAASEETLTPLGEQLGPVLEGILRIHAEIGYGSITPLGAREHRDMATRLLARQPTLFAQALTAGQTIEVHHSGRSRALQSAEAFTAGMINNLPAIGELIEDALTMPETVYFNDAEGAEDYQQFSDADPRLLQTLARLYDNEQANHMAQLLLQQLYTEDFVARLAAGDYQFSAAADDEDRIETALDAADALYGLYSIAAALQPELDRDFGHFMHPEATAWFAAIDDAESFYDRGPSFADDDITWRGAWALFDDMVSRAQQAALADNALAATLRFSHSQALVPFAVLLGIEGASEALPADQLYSYETSNWRSALAAPMGANVQWDIYRNEDNTLLVRMLHNEAETRFASNCQPWQDSAVFYSLDEIQRCYTELRDRWQTEHQGSSEPA